MQIDWFTLAAQVFNFLLLAALLWLVLYRPVRDAVERREEEISRRLEEAKEEREEAEALEEEYREKEEAMEEERRRILQEARDEAEERREKLREEIREEAERAREEWKASVRRERDEFLERLAERVREESYRIIRDALEDLLGGEPRQAFLETFLRRAREIPTEDRDAFVQAVEREGGALKLRSAFQVSPDDEDRIRDLVGSWLEGDGPELELSVSTGDQAPRGLELRAGDRKIAWSVDAYVQGLREEVERVMEEEVAEEEASDGEAKEGAPGEESGDDESDEADEGDEGYQGDEDDEDDEDEEDDDDEADGDDGDDDDDDERETE